MPAVVISGSLRLTVTRPSQSNELHMTSSNSYNTASVQVCVCVHTFVHGMKECVCAFSLVQHIISTMNTSLEHNRVMRTEISAHRRFCVPKPTHTNQNSKIKQPKEKKHNNNQKNSLLFTYVQFAYDFTFDCHPLAG